MWPSIEGTPFNEFQTKGYFSIAFPTLFLTSAADSVGTRMHAITQDQDFTHLMKMSKD
uniref:Uncharacterized protein n=1 Tax=Amphimedon queenslandica TaxID=400682 RepID=A0A1X7SQL2_AMPQE